MGTDVDNKYIIVDFAVMSYSKHTFSCRSSRTVAAITAESVSMLLYIHKKYIGNIIITLHDINKGLQTDVKYC